MTYKTTVRGFDDALPIALLRAREATMGRFKPHLDSHGITQPQWRVIRALADAGPMDATSLANQCVILAPSLTRIIKSQIGAGILRQQRHPDGRRKVVELTEKGRKLFEEVFARSLEIYSELEGAYGKAKMDQLLELLTDLRETAEQLPELE